MLTRPIVAATLAEAVSLAPRHLVVDLAAMTFCSARGFALLAETALAATTRDVAFPKAASPPTTTALRRCSCPTSA